MLTAITLIPYEFSGGPLDHRVRFVSKGRSVWIEADALYRLQNDDDGATFRFVGRA